MENQSTNESKKSWPAKPFQPGNKLAKGGKREGAGRKSKRNEVISDEIKSSARDYVRLQLEKHVGGVMRTYLKLAESGRDPTTTRHAVDKIDPDEHVLVPTITINFVAFNPLSSPSSPIDVTPQPAAPAISSPVIPSSPAPAPSASKDAPRLTFTDIVER